VPLFELEVMRGGGRTVPVEISGEEAGEGEGIWCVILDMD
jgi:hypothetical protein